VLDSLPFYLIILAERLYLKKKDSSDQSKYYSCVSEKDSRIIKSPKSESQNDFEMNIEESSFHINLGNFNPGTPLVKKQIIDEKEIIFKPATEVLGPSTSSSTINNIKSPENGPKLNMENYEKFGRQGQDPEEDKNEGEIFYEAKSSFGEEENINESQKSP